MAAVDRPTPRPRLTKIAADKPQPPPRRALLPLHESPPFPPSTASSESLSLSSSPCPSSPVLAVENPEYMSLEQFRQVSSDSSDRIAPSRHRQAPLPPIAMDALDDCVSVTSLDRKVSLELVEETRSTYDSWIDKHPLPGNPDAVGESVCFSSWTKVVLNKKDHKRLWCTLKNLTLIFYPSDEEVIAISVFVHVFSCQDTTISLGPIWLQHLIYIGNDVDSSSVAFSLVFDTTLDHISAPLNLQLTVADDQVRDCWLMLLAKVCLCQY